MVTLTYNEFEDLLLLIGLIRILKDLSAAKQ